MESSELDNAIIPEDIRQFLFQHIVSIAQLEGLLLLRSNTHQEWTTEVIAKRLYIDKKEATPLLEKLCDIGLLATSQDKSSYKYQPISLDLHQMADRITLIYSQYLLSVTHLIHSKRKNRMQEFANAFLIKKE